MGRVAGSYGVRGWVKLAPDRGAGEALAAAKEWWIGAEAYRVSEARLHGAAVVGKLAGIDTREQALALKGSAVSVRRASLPEPGEGHYYLADLVGLEVVNERGEARSEEHTSELQSQSNLVCRLLLEKKKKKTTK